MIKDNFMGIRKNKNKLIYLMAVQLRGGGVGVKGLSIKKKITIKH